MLPDILEMTIHHRDRYLVLKGLYAYGDTLFHDLTDVLPIVIKENLDDLVRISSLVKGPHSVKFLLSLLHDHSGLDKNIVHALWIKEYQPAVEDEKKIFSRILQDMLRSGKDKIRDHHEVSWFSDREIVKGSMVTEVKGDLVTALKICAILHGKNEVNRILELMSMEKNEKIFTALEMLELVLPNKISTELNYMFDFILDPDTRKIKYPEKPISLLFSKVVFNENHVYNPWTKAVCVYYSWKQNQTDLLTRLRARNISHEPFIIRETSDFVLNTVNH